MTRHKKKPTGEDGLEEQETTKQIRSVSPNSTAAAPQSIRSAIYARVSTADQHCEAQLTHLRENVAQRGWPKPGEYIDHGISGAKAKRPELDRLMADIRAGKLDVVLVVKIDRFSRSVLHLLQQLKVLEKHGVRFIAVDQIIDTDKSNPMSRMLLGILAVIAEFERELILERVRDGRKHKMESRPDSWNLPLGFEVVDDYPRINKDRMRLALQILQWKHRKKSLYEIADMLKSAGEKPPRGRRSKKDHFSDRWNTTTLSDICYSKAYYGIYERCNEDGFAPDDKNAPKKQWPIIDREGKLLAPISKQMWDEIQVEMDNGYQRNVGRHPKLPFLLHRMVYCRHENDSKVCNTRYTCFTNHIKGAMYRYYRCGNARKREKYENPPCANFRPLRADELEQVVWEAIWKILRDPDRLRELAICYQRESAKPTNALERDPRRDLENEQTEERHVIEMARRKIYPFEQAEAELKKIRRKIGLLQSEIAAMPKVVEIPNRDIVAESIREIAEGPEPETYEERRKVLDSLMDFAVRIDGDNVEIFCRLPISQPVTGEKNRSDRFTGLDNSFDPIPFIINARLAA